MERFTTWNLEDLSARQSKAAGAALLLGGAAFFIGATSAMW